MILCSSDNKTDGIRDFTLLVHDRHRIYPGPWPPEEERTAGVGVAAIDHPSEQLASQFTAKTDPLKRHGNTRVDRDKYSFPGIDDTRLFIRCIGLDLCQGLCNVHAIPAGSSFSKSYDQFLASTQCPVPFAGHWISKGSTARGVSERHHLVRKSHRNPAYVPHCKFGREKFD